MYIKDINKSLKAKYLTQWQEFLFGMHKIQYQSMEPPKGANEMINAATEGTLNANKAPQ